MMLIFMAIKIVFVSFLGSGRSPNVFIGTRRDGNGIPSKSSALVSLRFTTFSSAFFPVASPFSLGAARPGPASQVVLPVPSSFHLGVPQADPSLAAPRVPSLVVPRVPSLVARRVVPSSFRAAARQGLRVDRPSSSPCPYPADPSYLEEVLPGLAFLSLGRLVAFPFPFLSGGPWAFPRPYPRASARSRRQTRDRHHRRPLRCPCRPTPLPPFRRPGEEEVTTRLFSSCCWLSEPSLPLVHPHLQTCCFATGSTASRHLGPLHRRHRLPPHRHRHSSCPSSSSCRRRLPLHPRRRHRPSSHTRSHRAPRRPRSRPRPRR
mmetsp:Transcript_18378/g.45889  ORF Transcript_18378/g.45889 Transcript_18378/m.45889 type:complete len:319 (+) Transcript_18378:405-1361(+)